MGERIGKTLPSLISRAPISSHSVPQNEGEIGLNQTSLNQTG
jgi:hypothetical protein